jgi:hypothetical protein
VTRARLNIFLEPEHAKRMEELAVHKGISKSSIVAAALSSFLGMDGGEQREAVTGRRLDRLSRQFDRLERDQYILIETLALYIRYYLTVSLSVPDGQQEAARAQGRLRFAQFVEQLARHLQRGRSLVRDVQSDAFPQPDAPAEAASPGDHAE